MLSKGAIPPLLILNNLFGIILCRSTDLYIPNPLHVGHDPLGELNEKELGSGFLYAIPVVGHIKFLLKYLGFLLSDETIIITPSPELRASLIDESRRLLFFSLTLSLSITTSIVCVLYLSNLRDGLISIISSSTLTFKYPCLANLKNNSP